MRIGIVGSRRRADRDSVARLVRSLRRSDIVVSGGCRGVDTWAIEEADKVPLSHAEHLPAIRKGMSRDEMVQAYYDRNRAVAEDVDVLYAFVARDRTGGTENTIGHARRLGKKVVVVLEAEEVDETQELDSVKAEDLLTEFSPAVYNKRGDVPIGAIYVGRPSKWGNPFSHMPGTLAERRVYSREEAVTKYNKWLYRNHLLMEQARQELAGKNLVCWCAPLPCHADMLLKVANAPESREVDET